MAVVAGAETVAFTPRAYRRAVDLFDFDLLLPQMLLAVGLAMIVGSAVAWFKFRRGQTPKGMGDAEFRPGRTIWMLVVGTILSLWAGISLLT